MGDKAQASGRKSREEPLVFGVDFETDKARFRHRRFVELITASAALGIAVSGCAPPPPSPSPTPTPSASPTPTPSPSPTEPANLGTIPPGVTGAELQVDGVTQPAANRFSRPTPRSRDGTCRWRTPRAATPIPCGAAGSWAKR